MLHFDWTQYDLPRDERPAFMTITARDADGWEGSIVTNRDGEGLFRADGRGGYAQELGALQFKLPGSKDGIRRLFREMREQDRAE